MTDEILSQAEPIYCKGLTKKEYYKQYQQENKEKRLNKAKEYSHTRKGLVVRIYGHQKDGSKKRGYSMPNYSRKELQDWIFSQPNFEQLYQEWAKSGFNKNLSPSCDRLDDYKPYTLDNIRLVTWAVNNARRGTDVKSGINNKRSKAVLQLTREGIVIAEHHSVRQAARATAIDNIAACCRGIYKTAGGFVWCFA